MKNRLINFARFFFLCYSASNNASKENLPPETTSSNIPKNPSKLKESLRKSKKSKHHDDFSDLVDYMELESSEKEKHRIDIGRIHAVVQRSKEGDLVRVDNPNVADLLGIEIR